MVVVMQAVFVAVVAIRIIVAHHSEPASEAKATTLGFIIFRGAGVGGGCVAIDAMLAKNTAVAIIITINNTIVTILTAYYRVLLG